MVQVEVRMNPVSKAVYINPNVGDITYNLLQDIYKCQYWEQQQDQFLNQELNELLESYCDFMVQNWETLEAGTYNTVQVRPKMTFKELLTEQIVATNVPDLSKDTEIMNTVDEAVNRLSLIQNKGH